MLAAYYQRGMDSDPLFRELKIADCASYSAHQNQYDVIKLNMQEFLSETESVGEMLQMLRSYLIFDLKEAFGEVWLRDEKNLVQVMKDIYGATGHSFVILIDERDCLFREYQSDKEAQKKYLDFLRAWLKDFAREYYTVIREFPTGKEFADLCFIPRKMYADKPAVIVELKWDKSARGALEQVKDREYVETLKEYKGNLLLVGVNYDKKTKTHTCVIEKFEK